MKKTEVCERLLRLLYPNTCPMCGKVTQEEVCPVCRNRVQKIREPVCKRCGKPLLHERDEYCMDCARKKRRFEQGRALWTHEKQVRWSVYQFKFQNRRIYGRYYAKQMALDFENLLKQWKIDLLVPVPLSRSKKRKRGYNQAEILACCLSKQTGIPVDSKNLVRRRNTMPQMRLEPELRKENVRNAFWWKGGNLNRQKILLLDDIFTTGSTLDSAALELKKAGAQKVYFLTISIGQGN